MPLWDDVHVMLAVGVAGSSTRKHAKLRYGWKSLAFRRHNQSFFDPHSLNDSAPLLTTAMESTCGIQTNRGQAPAEPSSIGATDQGLSVVCASSRPSHFDRLDFIFWGLTRDSFCFGDTEEELPSED
jgi:hypothetical protein